MIFKLISTLLILSMLTAGCVELNQQASQTSYDLKYDLDEGDEFYYEINTSINQYEKKIELANMSVEDVGTNNVVLKISMNSITDENSKEDSYQLSMTNYGDIIEVSSDKLIIHEIEPKFMLTLPYTEKEIMKGEEWVSTFNKNDSHQSNQNSIKYNVIGNTVYNCMGDKIISSDAGDFKCVGFESHTDYILNIKSMYQNKTVYTQKITGNIQGESWVSLKDGSLVESTHDLNKNVKTNYLEINEELGIEKFHQETPISSTITIERLGI